VTTRRRDGIFVDRRVKKTWTITYRTARRVAIAVVGGTVVLLGIAMLVLPGPGILTIIGGLAILGLEFAFARRWLQRIKEKTQQTVEVAKQKLKKKGPPSDPPPPA